MFNQFGRLIILSSAVAFSSFVSAQVQDEYWFSFVANPKYYPDPFAACEGINYSDYPLYSVDQIANPESYSEEYRDCSRLLTESNTVQKYGSVTKRVCPVGTEFDSLLGCAPSSVNVGQSCYNIGYPINVATGNKFYHVVDYQDQNFTVARYYNSYQQGWSFNYRQKIVANKATELREGTEYFAERGALRAFRPDGSTRFYRYDQLTTNMQLTSNASQTRLQIVDDSFLEVLRYTPYHQENLPSQADHALDLLINGAVVEEYDSNGRLMAIRSPQQQTLISYRYEHSNASWPSHITINKNQSQITMETHASADIVIKIVLPDLSELRYEYLADLSSLDRVIRLPISGVEEMLYQYLYESVFNPSGKAGLITGIIDANLRRISSVQYDREGRAIQSEAGAVNSGIGRTKVQYHNDGASTVSNALNKQTTYHFETIEGLLKATQIEGHATANCVAANRNYTYTPEGFVASQTDWEGNTTTFEYNARGLQTQRVEAAGTPEARIIETQWHPEFNLPVRVIEPSRETLFDYDAQGRLLSQRIQPRS